MQLKPQIFQVFIKFGVRIVVLDTEASKSNAEDLRLKSNQVVLYGAVRHALTWISAWSAWHPVVSMVCSKLCVVIFGWIFFS